MVDPKVRFPESCGRAARYYVKSGNSIARGSSPLSIPLSQGTATVRDGGAYCRYRQVRDTFGYSVFARERDSTRGHSSPVAASLWQQVYVRSTRPEMVQGV